MNELAQDYANAMTVEDGNPEPEESLGIRYRIEDIDASGKTVILSYTGEGVYTTYKEYAEQILAGKTDEEIGQIFIEEKNKRDGSTYSDIYELIEDWYGRGATIEELYQGEGYSSFKEMVIGYEYVKPEEYQGANIVSTAKNGTHEIIGIIDEFIVTRNGIYTVKATAKDGRQAEVQVNITGINEEKFSTIYAETTTYTEGEKTAKIPAGFAVGISEGINTIEDGLVITDAVDSEGYSIGNEFVWIPVEADQFERQNLSNIYNGDWEKCTEPFNYTYDGKNYTGYENEETEYNTMRTQVLTHHGFYIGRYESGVNTATQRTNATTGAENIVIKRGIAPYNYVPWGVSNSDINSDVTCTVHDMFWDSIGTVQTKGAVYLSQNMYENPESVTSTLIYGLQWDAMCRYIQDYTRTTSGKNGPDLTGRIGGDNSKNIYDLAGNCMEWTMEGHSTIGRVLRGSEYINSDPVSNRHYTTATDNGETDENSFRVALYISDTES